MLGVEPWHRQREILQAVANHDRVAVRSGHKVSKSTSAAVLALWFACTKRNARVVMTSSSGRQVRIILWKELKKRYHGAKVALGGKLHEDPSAGLQFADGREILGFSTDEPEKMAGISGENVLFILDEASGIDQEIYEAIEGNRAGGAKIALFSNPTRTVGEFFDAFTAKAQFYHTIHVSSEETPNVTEGRIIIPGLATSDWVEEKRKEWGEDSPLYQVRVRGNFPSQAENAVIGLSIVEAALARHAEAKPEGLLEVGVDVARFGDDESVIYPVRGAYAYPPLVVRSMDGPSVAGKAMEYIRQLKQGNEVPVVKVDVIGYGASAYDALARCPGIEAIPVNVANRPTVDGYLRLRDQLWFGLKEWLAAGGAIPDDSKLQGELVAPTYDFTTADQIKVESKDKIKAKLKRSPDRADALAMAVCPAHLLPMPAVEGTVEYFDDYTISPY